MKKSMVILLMITFLVCNLISTGYTASKEKVYKWRAVTHQMVGTTRYVKTILPFCKMVKEASDGRLIIEPYGAGVLFPVTDSFDAVRSGVVEMSMVWSGYWVGMNPVFALAGSRPGDPITTFAENFYRAEQLAPILAKAYEKYGIKDLGSFDFATPDILCSTKPIRKLDDFKGLNIRTAGIGASYYKLLGASAISLSSPEIYSALQLGTVDAAEFNDWIINGQMGFDEVTKYVIEPCLHQGAVDDKELCVNPAAWASLPDDLKAIVLSCRDHARYLSAVSYLAENRETKREWIKKGIEDIQLPEEEVKKARESAAKFLIKFSKKSPESAEYLDTYIKVLQDLGYDFEAKLFGYSE